jgi:hypothetical protein
VPSMMHEIGARRALTSSTALSGAQNNTIHARLWIMKYPKMAAGRISGQRHQVDFVGFMRISNVPGVLAVWP